MSKTTDKQRDEVLRVKRALAGVFERDGKIGDFMVVGVYEGRERAFRSIYGDAEGISMALLDAMTKNLAFAHVVFIAIEKYKRVAGRQSSAELAEAALRELLEN